MLGERGRADREVAGQPVDGAAQPLGDEQPAQPPAGHREVLGEGVDDDRLPRGRPGAGRRGGARVGDPVVDLVADQLDPGALAVGRQRGQLVRRQHGARRVGRAGDDQPVDPVEVLQHRDGGLVAGLRAARQLDDLAAQRREDVAVAGIAGAGHRDAVADVEGREEGEQEAAGRAGGQHHVVRGDRQAVGVAVVRGDAGPQLGQPQRDGVAEHVALQRVGGRAADGPGRGRGGLAGGEVDQVAVGALPLARGGPDVHDVEGRDRRAGGLVQSGSTHVPTLRRDRRC